MKIEKISETQIRCTLTKEDLLRRQLKISELAYGSEKARVLFREMMQQASYEFGFEAEDIPLMVEAIPLSTESVILVITKVEYPEELDTRFSRFSDEPEETDPDYADNMRRPEPEGADSVLDLFRRITEERRIQERYALYSSEGYGSDQKRKSEHHKALPFQGAFGGDPAFSCIEKFLLRKQYSF